MYIKKRFHKNYVNIFLSFVVLIGFCYLLIMSDKYNITYKQPLVNAEFISSVEKSNNDISIDNLIGIEDYVGKFSYIVQPGDNLSSIAFKFGTTIENIKNVNNLKSDKLSPGLKIIITQEDGIIYEMNASMSLKDFATKYNLDEKKLAELNYIEDANQILDQNDEIFLPIGVQQAQKIGLIQIAKEENPVELITRNTKSKSNTKSIKKSKKENPVEYKSSNDNIIEKRYYKPNIQNKFYAGHCTWFVALKKFPIVDGNKQIRLWNGNAVEWYKNAKNAGYEVGSTPRPGAIIVLRYGGRHYYYYGHVGIVLQVDKENNRILIEDMNYLGRFIVTKRWADIDGRIVGYIYL